MSLPIVFRRLARREMSDAAEWYEHRREGLGEEFIEEVEFALLQAAESPRRFPRVFGKTREVAVRRFPFCIYYREDDARVIVLGVIHTSRDPRIWQARR